MSIKNKLNRLKPHIKNETKTNRLLESDETSIQEDIPFRDEWDKAGVKPYFFDGSYCLVREKEYPLDYKHGIYSFAEFASAVDAWNTSDVKHPLSASGHKPEDLFFFDTETTGLGGGAGNSIFLLGHASLTKNSIKLKQYILPHPGAEVPLYKSFLENIDYTTMVTYNGKAFDWPQVKTRHTLIREHVPKLPPFGHFDLYHAARRMWKHKLDRIKLSAVEKEVLGVERKDDIPGFLAPMIFFDFVERKNPEGMLGIIKHNEIDILSLISLYTHLSFQLLRMDEKQTVREIYEVGRWFSSLGESSAAKTAFSNISTGDGNDALEAKHALAYEYKKLKNWEDASRLWIDVAERGNLKIRIESSLELAKIFEHRKKDLTRALYYCENMKKICQEMLDENTGKINISMEEILKRQRRLTNKISSIR